MFSFDKFIFSIIPSSESSLVYNSFNFASFLFNPIPFIFLTLVTLIIVFRFASKKDSYLFVVIMFLSLIFVWSLKEFFNIERPLLKNGINFFGPSFPSAHATFATSYFLFVLHILRRESRKIVRFLHFIFCVLCAVFVGVSRIYFGVHWLSDVLAGYILGAFVVYISMYLIDKYYGQKRA